MTKLKEIVTQLDKVASDVEDIEMPLAYQVVCRLDKIAQELTELSDKSITKLAHVSDSIIKQYEDNILFLNNNQVSLKDLIKKQGSSEPKKIYKALKKHFGSLSKEESINFIKNILTIRR